MQGDCSGATTKHLPDLPAADPPLEPLRPGQCILLAQEDALAIVGDDIWVDNLYLRTLFTNAKQGLARKDGYIALTAIAPLNGTKLGSGARYFSRMTFQGDNKGPTVGVFADEKVFVEGMLASSARSIGTLIVAAVGPTGMFCVPVCPGLLRWRTVLSAAKMCCHMEPV